MDQELGLPFLLPQPALGDSRDWKRRQEPALGFHHPNLWGQQPGEGEAQGKGDPSRAVPSQGSPEGRGTL